MNDFEDRAPVVTHQGSFATEARSGVRPACLKVRRWAGSAATLALLAVVPSWATAAPTWALGVAVTWGFHLPSFVTGLSTGTSTLCWILNWLFRR